MRPRTLGSAAMKMQEPPTTPESSENAVVDGRLDIPAGAELSPALRRLVEEVRMEATASSSAARYDRMHNRHNRGEAAPMSDHAAVPIDTVLLKTASRCNIACTYCYVYRLGDHGWRRQPPTMSQSTIDASVRRLDELRQAQDRDFAVVLHGGEPLLLSDTLLARLLTGLRTRLPAGCTLSVQTNGRCSPPAGSTSSRTRGPRSPVSLRSPRPREDQRFAPPGVRPARTYEGNAYEASTVVTPPPPRSSPAR